MTHSRAIVWFSLASVSFTTLAAVQIQSYVNPQTNGQSAEQLLHQARDLIVASQNQLLPLRVVSNLRCDRLIEAARCKTPFRLDSVGKSDPLAIPALARDTKTAARKPVLAAER